MEKTLAGKDDGLNWKLDVMRNLMKLAVLFLAQWTGLFLLSRWLTRSDLRILCYHAGAISDESGYNPKLFLSAETLTARMRWLQCNGFNIVSLDEAVRPEGQAGMQPVAQRLPTVITFDDGWYSTGSELLPVLAALNVPSTLYLCTKHFNEGWPVLDVAVRYILWKSPLKKISEARLYPELEGEFDLTTQQSRDQLACKITHLIAKESSSREQVCASLERLATAVSVPTNELQLQSRRFDYMSPEELLAARDKNCSIELHGHVHRYPAGDPDAFRRDLEVCGSIIRSAGLPKSRHYCYPSGRFDAAASPVLTELDVLSATTCKPGLVRKITAASRHYLPRFLDGENVHMLEFKAELSGFSDLLRRALRAQ